MKKITVIMLLLAPVLLAGCADETGEVKVEKEPVFDSRDGAVFETGEVPIQTESTGDINQDIEEIDSIMELDEADTGEDISDESLGI